MTRSIRLLAVVAALVSTPAFAAKKVLVRCSNEDNTKLVLTQNGDKYEAAISMESTGDSYPTFHYKNLTLQEQPVPRPAGAPMIYSSKDITIRINFTAAKEPATIDASNIGIHNEVLYCR